MKTRRELLFLYDIRKGNPNGDPDENRPRVFPDGSFYVTDVRLKRYVRDTLKQQGHTILVDRLGERTVSLDERIDAFLESREDKKSRPTGEELVKVLREGFVDMRMFGSSLALKKQKGWDPKPVPKTLTGAVQFNHGEVLHRAQEMEIYGTSTFGSDKGKEQGTFTSYYGLRYGLVGFHGIANEHSARLSGMSEADYELLLPTLWRSVRSAANTRTKMDQLPRLLVSIEYKEGSDFQLGDLLSRLRLEAVSGKAEEDWSSVLDYRLDLSPLASALERVSVKVDRVRVQHCPDLQLASELPGSWESMDLDGLGG
jgi:CRISPR-associated protein Csh2